MTDSTLPCRLVVLISGRGSNLQAIGELIKTAGLNGRIEAVISNKGDAPGLEWAQRQGLPTETVSHREFATREAFDQALARVIDRYQPDYVLLAGFMRILSTGFVQHYAGKLINIHPSLLPSFPGLNTHQQALDAGVQFHGCSVHFVTPVLDDGPIIAQSIVPVLHDDDAQTLAERVLATEHHVYTEAVRWLIEGRVRLQADGRVEVAGLAHRGFYFPA
ncbi:phosphoribosylglycinamide formyltransferase [Alcaligenes faecalis]|uniref:Phosphoribosylglycinamide formyltransferase n=1 Tax=Alcaligenes faecalis TaxID=511 RepID=A0ABY7N6S4_ALCFA|nr:MULTISPECIES: phosphoribosylglycinamide formyltransferase [Alcaligenes]ALO39772.1 phosphoribosylglycinamide formyltransferase [Alcaligenes faecalis]KAA1286769.1 phosphoribosylglycinamide formyltransferase [Alcaligenes faecalis]MBQ0218193.1 phosphoribosylglycinamide formyltransferase [Alcaligenes faecalis]MDT0217507.1 phosphoribosylglycinamide formyltransferase [Alcaligenes sp. AB3]OSZ36058.1 phosphoribosylglycinamide formyltransferase [Alcaligenes faecalis]